MKNKAALKISYGRFSLLVIIITLVIYGFCFLTDRFLAPGRMNTGIWMAPAFFCAMSLLVYYIAIQAFRVSSSYFNSVIFGSMAVRMLLCLVYIFFALGKSDNTLFFITIFFVLYLLYTVFEIYCLISNLRPDFKKKGIQDD